MSTVRKWRNLRKAFHELGARTQGRLLAECSDSETYLADDPDAEHEFKLLADQSIALTGLDVGPEPWRAWLTLLVRERFGRPSGDVEFLANWNPATDQHNERRVTSWTQIADVIGVSARYCQLIAVGHPPARPAEIPAVTVLSGAEASNSSAVRASNKARVDACLLAARKKHNRRITRKEFWSRCGYTNATEFQRWQRDDLKTTAAARANFERCLKELA